MSTSTQPRHYLSDKKIIVSGAGIGGLSFVLSLCKQWPEQYPRPTIVIYERDAQENALGRVGYSLSLRNDVSNGIQTLQKMGLLDEIKKRCVIDLDHTGGFAVWNKHGKEYIILRTNTRFGSQFSGMRIARSALRAVLLEAVLSYGVQIQWGVGCVATKLTGCVNNISLSDGKTDECNLLIAADGAASKIRSVLRPSDGLRFTGVNHITATAVFDEWTPPPPLDDYWGFWTDWDGVALFCAQIDAKSMIWSISYKAKDKRTRAQAPWDDLNYKATIQEAKERGAAFADVLNPLIDRTNPETLLTGSAIDKKPFKHSSSDSFFQKVVFIGDANHAVSQFAGAGANLAMADGWDLAESLVKGQTLKKAIKIYDSKAISRASEILFQSHFTIQAVHSSGILAWLNIAFMRMVHTVFGFFNLI